jgi:hypothetical protein
MCRDKHDIFGPGHQHATGTKTRAMKLAWPPEDTPLGIGRNHLKEHIDGTPLLLSRRPSHREVASFRPQLG